MKHEEAAAILAGAREILRIAPGFAAYFNASPVELAEALDAAILALHHQPDPIGGDA